VRVVVVPVNVAGLPLGYVRPTPTVTPPPADTDIPAVPVVKEGAVAP
jgi:hypothetical protein